MLPFVLGCSIRLGLMQLCSQPALTGFSTSDLFSSEACATEGSHLKIEYYLIFTAGKKHRIFQTAKGTYLSQSSAGKSRH